MGSSETRAWTSPGRGLGPRLATMLSSRTAAWLTGVVLITAIGGIVLAVGPLGGDGNDDAARRASPGAGHPDLPPVDDGSPASFPSTAVPATGPAGNLIPSCLPAADGRFELEFVEEFEGDSVDPGSWYLYDSVGNAGFGLRRPAAITTSAGRLVITAQMIGDDLVSGGMANNLSQTYGRWEFRVRTDPDPSAATSGVVLTWPSSGRWPIDGENDIYETEENPSRSPFSTFIHFGADNQQEMLSHAADGTEWHDMAMDWTPAEIVIYLDGQLAGRITRPEAIPHVPHHLTIQLDAWRDQMGDPVTMEVDWVRVYRYDQGGVC